MNSGAGVPPKTGTTPCTTCVAGAAPPFRVELGPIPEGAARGCVEAGRQCEEGVADAGVCAGFVGEVSCLFR
jgi:hypothetical protein